MVHELLIPYRRMFFNTLTISPTWKIGNFRPRRATNSIAILASTSLLGFVASAGVMPLIMCWFLLLYSALTLGIKSYNWYLFGSIGGCFCVSRGLFGLFIFSDIMFLKVRLNRSTKMSRVCCLYVLNPRSFKLWCNVFQVRAPSSSVYRTSGCLPMILKPSKIAGMRCFASLSFSGVTIANLINASTILMP